MGESSERSESPAIYEALTEDGAYFGEPIDFSTERPVNGNFIIDGLCAMCRQIFENWSFVTTRVISRGARTNFTHHESFHDVMGAAKSGCNLVQ
jgi:hypothetical protein